MLILQEGKYRVLDVRVITNAILECSFTAACLAGSNETTNKTT